MVWVAARTVNVQGKNAFQVLRYFAEKPEDEAMCAIGSKLPVLPLNGGGS